jgi:PAS domain S-box-containing protein
VVVSLLNFPLENVEGTLAAVVGAVAAVGACYRALVRPAVRLIRQVLETCETVSEIAAQFKPNGGSSLRDSINRLENDSKKMKEQLVVNEQRVRAILTDDNFALYETDREGQCIWANQTYLSLVGYAPEQMQGNGWIMAIAEEDRNRVVDEWFSAVHQQRESDLEFTIASRDGSRVKVRGHAYPLRNHLSELVGYFGQITILERQAA